MSPIISQALPSLEISSNNIKMQEITAYLFSMNHFSALIAIFNILIFFLLIVMRK